MKETLERIAENISKIETKMESLADDLYHLRLESNAKGLEEQGR